MKIRSDFVSNSSSSSFIIGERPIEAAKMFLDDFGEFLQKAWNDPLGETMKIGYKRKSCNDDWFQYESPGTFCYKVAKSIDKDNLEYDSNDNDEEDNNIDINDIMSIIFECDDYDNTAIMYMRFLYTYFEKFGFKPDDSDTEQDFKDGECLLEKLLSKISLSRDEENEGKK